MNFFQTAPDDLANIAARGMAIGFGNFRDQSLDVFTNYPIDWQKEYDSRGWVREDPVVKIGATKTGLHDWPEADAPQTKFMSAAHDFGLTKGIIISQDIGGNRCIAGLCIDAPLSEAARQHALKIVREMHLDRLTQKAENLSDGQKDLIYLFANGFRAKQVADMFEISEDAVKQRKQIIQRHLGINNFLVVINICARAGITFHRIS